MSSSSAHLIAVLQDSYDELVGYLRTRVGCATAAQDIAQETYLRLRSDALPEVIDKPKAFIYRIATNLALNHLRNRRTREQYVTSGPLPEAVTSDEPSAETQVDQQQLLAHLLAAVEELPPRCREVFVLRKLQHLEMQDIADRLGISLRMAEKHLAKAFAHCTARFKELDDDAGR